MFIYFLVRNNVPDVQAESVSPFKYIICTTKNLPDVPPLLVDVLAPAITPGYSVIVLIQNGLNIEKPFHDAFPTNIVLSGVSLCDSHEIGTGTGYIRQDQHDRVRIGAFRNPRLDRKLEVQAAQDFCTVYAAAGKCTAEYASNVGEERWCKLLYNACLASVCAITDLDSGRVQLADGLSKGLVRVAANEICAAAAACGHPLSSDAPDVMLSLDPINAYSSPSMQVDVRKGRFCEVETILGEPLREGVSHGVPMPTIAAIYHILKARQWQLKEKKGWVTIPEPAQPAELSSASHSD